MKYEQQRLLPRKREEKNCAKRKRQMEESERKKTTELSSSSRRMVHAKWLGGKVSLCCMSLPKKGYRKIKSLSSLFFSSFFSILPYTFARSAEWCVQVFVRRLCRFSFYYRLSRFAFFFFYFFFFIFVRFCSVNDYYASVFRKISLNTCCYFWEIIQIMDYFAKWTGNKCFIFGICLKIVQVFIIIRYRLISVLTSRT